MKNILSKAGENALSTFLNRKTLLAFDLDGTLAAIHPDPQQIEILPDIQHALMLLMQYQPVAIITGRSCLDAKRFLKITPDYLIGNHGAEGLRLRASSIQRFKKISSAWKMQLLQNLEISDTGILLEDKGFSLSVHYRHAPDQEQTRNKLFEIIARLAVPPRVVEGKYVINLVPSDAPHKGDALLDLLRQSGTEQAFFLGDDITDEDVFNVQCATVFKVRVGQYDASKADWFVNTQADVLTLLKVMVYCLNSSLTSKDTAI